MKKLPLPKAMKIRKIMRTTMLLGLMVFLVSTYLMVTGHYDSYMERRAADTFYNNLAIGSLLYIAVSWVTCVMTKPFWFPLNQELSD